MQLVDHLKENLLEVDLPLLMQPLLQCRNKEAAPLEHHLQHSQQLQHLELRPFQAQLPHLKV